jgi:hypothetical protein
MFLQVVHRLIMLNFLNKLRLTYARVNPQPPRPYGKITGRAFLLCYSG